MAKEKRRKGGKGGIFSYEKGSFFLRKNLAAGNTSFPPRNWYRKLFPAIFRKELFSLLLRGSPPPLNSHEAIKIFSPPSFPFFRKQPTSLAWVAQPTTKTTAQNRGRKWYYQATNSTIFLVANYILYLGHSLRYYPLPPPWKSKARQPSVSQQYAPPLPAFRPRKKRNFYGKGKGVCHRHYMRILNPETETQHRKSLLHEQTGIFLLLPAFKVRRLWDTRPKM